MLAHFDILVSRAKRRLSVIVSTQRLCLISCRWLKSCYDLKEFTHVQTALNSTSYRVDWVKKYLESQHFNGSHAEKLTHQHLLMQGNSSKQILEYCRQL